MTKATDVPHHEDWFPEYSFLHQAAAEARVESRKHWAMKDAERRWAKRHPPERSAQREEMFKGEQDRAEAGGQPTGQAVAEMHSSPRSYASSAEQHHSLPRREQEQSE